MWSNQWAPYRETSYSYALYIGVPPWPIGPTAQSPEPQALNPKPFQVGGLAPSTQWSLTLVNSMRTFSLTQQTSVPAVSLAAATAPRTQLGKGVAKITAEWVGPKIGAVAAAQHKKAAQLRKTIRSNTEAIAKLQELSAQEKTPSSLTVKLPPAAQKNATASTGGG